TGGGRRPGGWPTAAPAGGGRAPAAQGRPATPAAPGTPATSATPAAPAPTPGSGGLDPRTLWPNVLEAVKNRRRFTWILLSQNAQVVGFDGTTLQIGFVNAGARDNFLSSGSEDVLRQALAEQFNVQWKVEAIVDPSGGSAPPATGGSGFGGGFQPGGGGASPAPRPAPAEQPASSARPATSASPAPAPPAPAPAAPPTERHVVAPEDDMPEDDDPDLDESALSGHDLIVRELGATVVEEFSNE
ncbi:DNA polymerase III subunit gamma and tau, partial [Streptomyces sp. NPDC004096]